MVLYNEYDKIVPYLREIVEKMKAGEYDIEEIAIRKTLNKRFEDYKAQADFMRGVHYANKHLNADIRPGDFIKVIYVKNVVGYPQTDVISFLDKRQLPKIEIDVNKIIDRTVRRKVEKILRLCNIPWDVITSKMTISEAYT